MMQRFPATFAEQRRGVEEVILPLGHPEAIKRLARDLIAFGFGIGEAPAQSAAQLEWYEKAEDALERLSKHVDALSAAAVSLPGDEP